jgi:hypothetical protein
MDFEILSLLLLDFSRIEVDVSLSLLKIIINPVLVSQIVSSSHVASFLRLYASEVSNIVI